MKAFFFSVVLLCSAFVAGTQPYSYAGNTGSTANTESYIEYLLGLGDYDVCERQHAYLVVGQSAYFYRTFHAGQEYKLVAFTEDEDVHDVDIKLYEQDGTLYEEDVDNSDVAVVSFTPARTRTMKVMYKNYASDDTRNSSLCRVMIGYK